MLVVQLSPSFLLKPNKSNLPFVYSDMPMVCYTLLVLNCNYSAIPDIEAKGRLPQNVPFCHIDNFELKQLEKQSVQEGYSDPLCPPTPKPGNKSPMCKIPSLYWEVERHPYPQRQGIQSHEGCINKSCYVFANLLPKPKMLFRIPY